LALDHHALSVFESFLSARGVTEPRQLDRRILAAFVDFLRERYRIRSGVHRGHPLRGSTLYGWVSIMRGFVAHLVRSGWLLVDPCLGLARPRYPRTRRRFIPTVAEVRRFLAGIRGRGVFSVRDRALFELLYATALRAGEASHLDVYDLDPAGGTLRVREGKGSKDRVVPVGRVAAGWLVRYLRQVRPLWAWRETGEALWVTRRGTRMSVPMIDGQCRRWRARTGLPLLTPHALRHAAATHMLAAGADIRQLQVLLGHAWITTTDLYTHLRVDDLARAHRQSHPREVRGRDRRQRRAVSKAPEAQGLREEEP